MQAPLADPLVGLDNLNKALPLVGRSTEMQVIHFVLNTVQFDLPAGARALTISGEIGVGKSRLLAEMYTAARELGFRVLEGRTYASGNMFPYLPFIEALRPLLRSSSQDQLRHYMGLITSPGSTYASESRAHASTVADSYASQDDDEQFAAAPQHEENEDISLRGIPMIAALARLFADLPSLLGITVVPEMLTPDQEKFRLLDAVATLLEHMALEQPILLGIDDLQWADSASLELTLYLTVRLRRSRVALVGTTRPVSMINESTAGVAGLQPAEIMAASAAATKALAELMRQGLLFLLPLGPLDADAAAQHLRALLPGTLPEDAAQTLLKRTEGNPFLLEELVRMLTLNHQLVQHKGTWRATRAMNTALPGSITLAVGERLQGLSHPCHEFLRVASLFGRTFPLPALLEVLAQTQESATLPCVEEASRAALIAIVPPRTTAASWHEEDISFEDPLEPLASVQLTSPTYMFCQGIVQEVLSSEIPVYQARKLHAAIGRALEITYVQAAPAHAAELARHFLLGDAKAAALHWSLLAGEDAARQHAHREAISHFLLALRLLEAGETSTHAPSLAQLHTTIGELWFKLGELERATRSLQQALSEAPPVDAHFGDGQAGGRPQEMPLQVARTNRLLADVYRMQGRYDQALAHLLATRTALEAGREAATDPAEVTVPWFPGRSFPAAGHALTFERFLATERMLFLHAQATLDILLNRRQEAEAALWQSHQLAIELGDRESQAFALHLLSWLRGWGEHIRDAIRLQEQAHAIYIAIGDPFHAALGDQGLGIIYLALGETERASLYTLRGLERARRYGARYSLGWLYWNHGVIALSRGDWTASASHLQESMHEAETTNNGRLKPLVLQAQAELVFRQGDWQQAESLFQESIQTGINTEWYPSALALYGHFLAVTGRRAAARAQLDQAAAQTEPPGYGGDFYIPFLAEGYIHLEAHTEAVAYIERIRALRGFMYYGSSVDRILGEVAAQAHDWEMAEQAFEKGLALCRRAANQPEEAAILYEQARTLLMQSGNQAGEQQQESLRRVHNLCEQARALFLQY
ncbi:MAG TPA: AAA family ATPase, partial [Ktedonobacteraceae bacterium]|nr:AAA family ATPase [Ktedonobacteraceae bacterium]